MGKSPDTKVPVNDVVMTNTEAQAKIITDTINKCQTVKPLTIVKPMTKSCFNGTPLTLSEVPPHGGTSTPSNSRNDSTATAGPSQERPHLRDPTPITNRSNIIEPGETTDTDSDGETLPVLDGDDLDLDPRGPDVSVEESTPNDLDTKLKTMTVNTPKGYRANKVIHITIPNIHTLNYTHAGERVNRSEHTSEEYLNLIVIYITCVQFCINTVQFFLQSNNAIFSCIYLNRNKHRRN